MKKDRKEERERAAAEKAASSAEDSASSSSGPRVSVLEYQRMGREVETMREQLAAAKAQVKEVQSLFQIDTGLV